MEKKYKNLEDVLTEGKHKIKVYPKQEWDDTEKKFKEGTHRSGIAKSGNPFWLYSTKIEEEYVNIIAFDDEQKKILDSGEVEVNVVQKTDRATKELMFKVVDGKTVKILKAFINPVKTEAKEEKPVSVDELPF